MSWLSSLYGDGATTTAGESAGEDGDGATTTAGDGNGDGDRDGDGGRGGEGEDRGGDGIKVLPLVDGGWRFLKAAEDKKGDGGWALLKGAEDKKKVIIAAAAVT
ncbi:hypothetical protein LOK49_LG07G01887 [Camellia lanceoleosa]|uniref:Uncharacterized protein n=1 Tax=Camellia lanceoleosa TaxID=1840588 RepID=A0ACC0H401_9ERIC|nr:hypothetical protein LOK49_LG07G01887 [Camellia lanceoleosa]